MSKGKGVSGKTHTKEQLDYYADLNNSNSKIFEADKKNHEKQMRERGKK